MTKSDLFTKTLRNYLIEYFAGLGVESPEISFDKPVLAEHGDISNNASLKYSKDLGKNPMDLARDAADWLKNKNIEEIEDVKFAEPGYVNIFLNSKFTKEVLEDIILLGDKYGSSELLKGEKWVVEHTSPNPNKAMHLGHLRNNLIGMSIARLLEYSGATVICDSVDNNRGIAIAKLMWGFLLSMKKNDEVPTSIDYWQSNPSKWSTPEDLNMPPGRFVAECYVSGETDFKNSQSVEEKVRDLVVKWENNDPTVRKLWEHVLKYSYQGINQTLSRIGNRWDKTWHEHEHYQEGKEFVKEGLKKGIFVKLEDGAVLTNLEKYNLPDTILLKNDGTSLYITQDIALTALKKKEYKAKKLVWVIGPEQSMAMKQMFAICEQLGIGTLSDFTHIPYGYVGLKTKEGFKKMSSREGTVVLIDDVLDTVKEKISEKLLVDNRGNNNDINLSEKLALAAVKFSLLKAERMQGVAFDVTNSIEVHGDTGVYLLYTYARINSILRKADSEGLLVEPQQIDIADNIVKILSSFGSVVQKSLESYSAHHISQYLLQLSSAFNSWYSQEKILNDSQSQPHKLAVAKAVACVIKNGLAILGIDVVEQI
jgi:arginyl-tRNA synthetase